MSFIINNWILIFAAVTSGAMLLWPLVGKGGGTGAVSPADAVRLINQEKAVLIDVCEPAEFAAGHATGARNVPLGSLDGGKGLPTNKALPLGGDVCHGRALLARGRTVAQGGLQQRALAGRRQCRLARGQPADRKVRLTRAHRP